MGDMKRKKETDMVEKIENVERGESGPVGFAELRDDLFREAAKLVSEVPSTRIAIFVTPPPSESDISVQSFGYPSAEAVVQTFLEDKCPVPVPEDDEDDEQYDDEEEEDPSPKRFWWEDDKQFDSMNPEQLKAASDKLLRLRNHLRLQLESTNRGQVSGNHEDLHNDKAGPKP